MSSNRPTSPRAPARWRAPGAGQIAASAERQGFRLSPDTLAAYVRMASGSTGSHDRVQQAWDQSRPAESATVVSEPGTDPWYAVDRMIHGLVGPPGGWLTGRTLAVKSTLRVAGVPLGAGSRLWEEHVPKESATAVAWALAAGAEVAYTGMPDDLCVSLSGMTCRHRNPARDHPVINPWSTRHSTWGSSAGAAAIVTAGLADGAILVDQAGSGRAPSAGCGLIALMPTRGVLPTTGALGFTTVQDRLVAAARTTDLVARIASAISGRDGRDLKQGAACPPRDWVSGLRGDVRGLRIGLVAESLDPGMCDPAVVAAVEECARDLTRLGAEVRVVHIPSYGLSADLAMLLTVHRGVPDLLSSNLGSADAVLEGDPDLVEMVAAQRVAHPEFMAETVRFSALVAGDDGGRPDGYWNALTMDMIRHQTRAFDEAMSGANGCHVLMTPAVPSPPRLLPDRDLLTPEEYLELALSGLEHTCGPNLTGHPALVAPLDPIDGLPVGVQYIAPNNREDQLLRPALAREPQGGYPAAPGPHRQEAHR